MKKFLMTAAALTLLVGGQALAAENPVAAKLARDVCSKCHGTNGISQSSLFPRLAGQQAEYIENELHQFRERGRADPHAQAYMWGIAGPLTDAQIKALAEYYASKTPVHGEAPSDAAAAARGKEIYFNGDSDHGIPACVACHGEHAEGNGAIPRLAGQHFDYLYRQIQDFRSELRENETMHENVKTITDEQAIALAQYLSSQ